jgi:hypothetical protein
VDVFDFFIEEINVLTVNLRAIYARAGQDYPERKGPQANQFELPTAAGAWRCTTGSTPSRRASRSSLRSTSVSLTWSP